MWETEIIVRTSKNVIKSTARELNFLLFLVTMTMAVAITRQAAAGGRAVAIKKMLIDIDSIAWIVLADGRSVREIYDMAPAAQKYAIELDNE
ncbi:hypothetical protein HYD_4830 [Candidatus Hydrogenosomobacter endosymbioticus]|uniref:Uncharacterized protein n=1 Tax=Candidatus Hydrogenosomobacter endosymbioticus TaxID=2558174 RepID=A0ABM7VA42_9PROT|nr:hypothetical protein HYD_4830 [Candidatus Hydrogenosomobacter endosymbioticus]